MAFKFVAVLAFVTVASAGYIQPQLQQQQHDIYQSGPAEHQVVLAPPHQHHQILEKTKIEEYDSHPQYKFAYNVDDSVTGDSKSHSETRNGDAVEGEYSLNDADGYRRIVHYTADHEHGFNAVVTRVPLHGAHEADHHAPAVVKTVQPVAYASSPSNYYKSEPTHYETQAPAAAHGLYSAPAQNHQAPYIQAHESNSGPSAYVVKSSPHGSEYHN
ncbi:cuticle protein 8-like [Episyrphus balteatus]|uniref:cuticle protein 8-like n=1 Tax=Episyrphus balteatus TaxID=286459 RepID=UPI0024862953|nr:cuticle protein 8-like [Episyrphus balteatus]